MGLSEITNEIEFAAKQAGRKSGDINLIAVSKMQPDAVVEQVLAAGHRVFGENRIQEAQSKWPKFRETYPDAKLHIIGPLQSNKTRTAMELAQAIHSVDRPKLVEMIARLAQELGSCPDLFIQVNTGEEPQKAGILPQETDQMVERIRGHDLPLKGLMCIPPVDEEPSLHFALLAKLAGRNGLVGLSMGMSNDFKTAIAQGATHIRVGSAIFGERT